jgi:hypothetical protein
LSRVLQVIKAPLPVDSELALIFDVIKEKTGVDHEKIQKKSDSGSQGVKVFFKPIDSNPRSSTALRAILNAEETQAPKL